MELFFFWFALSVATAIFAGTKGRTRIGWFCSSILLSPIIGLILIAILPTKTYQSSEIAINPTRDKLIELKKLVNEGLITQDEYSARRKIILESKDT
jgi:hypothetical protein